MEIKVIGEGCEKCTKLYEHVCQAAEQLEWKADITKVEDLIEMIQLGVMTTPSVMVDGKLIISGQVPSVKQIVPMLQKFADMSNRTLYTK